MPSRNTIKHYLPNACFHAMNRGVNGAPIFADDHDRLMFMDSLTRKLPSPDIELLAYCLMPNHFHLVLRQTPADGIQRFVRSTMTSYVRRHNGRHNRYGTLFQSVFKAPRIDHPAGIRSVIAYTHLNPIDVRTMPDYESYEFSSHGLYTGQRSEHWFNPRATEEIFGSLDGYRRKMRWAERNKKQLNRQITALWSPIAPRTPNTG